MKKIEQAIEELRKDFVEICKSVFGENLGAPPCKDGENYDGKPERNICGTDQDAQSYCG